MSPYDRLATDLAAAQGGVLTRSQAMELGMTARQIERRLASGSWEPVKRGVYRLIPPGDRMDLMRTVLASWPGSVVSHESAASVHEFPYVDATELIVSHHTRTTHDFPYVRVRRTHDLDVWHVTTVSGVRLTTVARTIVDLAGERSVKHMGAIVDQMVSRKAVDLLEVEAVLGSIGRRGKPGTVTMREVLEERLGDDRSASVLERRGRDLIQAAGLPMPVSEFPVPWTTGRRFDDAYPDRQIAIEWDSRRFHGQMASFEADRVKDRDGAVFGWKVLRFTWDDVHNHPYRVTETLRALLAA